MDDPEGDDEAVVDWCTSLHAIFMLSLSRMSKSYWRYNTAVPRPLLGRAPPSFVIPFKVVGDVVVLP